MRSTASVAALLLALLPPPAASAQDDGPRDAARPAAASRPERPRRRAASRPASRPAEQNYVRVAGEGTAARLETGWRVLAHADGREVWLVGAVHVADPGYFAALNELLGAADVVLYEGVSGEPTADMTTIKRLQLALGRALGLGFQKDGVVYGRPHFVHADLDAAEIEKRLAARGESLMPGGDAFRLFGPVLANLMERAADAAEAAERAGAPAPSAALKRLAARTLASPDAGRNVRSRAWDDVVIGARNERAVEIAAPFLAAGRTRCAIFYGAAHLPDFERRFAELGFRPGPLRWIPAWSLGPDAPAASVTPPAPATPPL
jgi:hypothetical protein